MVHFLCIFVFYFMPYFPVISNVQRNPGNDLKQINNVTKIQRQFEIFYAINRFTSIVRKTNQICSFSNYHKIHLFVNQRWHDARKELQLPILHIPTKCDRNEKSCEHIKDTHNTMMKYFNQFTSQVPVWNINGTLIAHARIYKVANEGIGYNLNRWAQMIDDFKGRQEHFVVKRYQVNELHHAIKYYENDNITAQWKNFRPFDFTSKFRARNSDFKTFAYIREPLQRFESGFSEAVYRTKGLRLNSTEDITNILKKFLDYQYVFHFRKPIIGMFHVFPQSGVYFNFDIDITLHLETFLQDWERVVVPTYNLPPNTFDSKLGFHATAMNHPMIKSKDATFMTTLKRSNATKVRGFIRNLYRDNQDTMRAICHLILIDYICFPEYALPPPCQFLNDTLLEGKALLTS